LEFSQMKPLRNKELSAAAAEQSHESAETIPYCAVCGEDSRIHGTPTYLFGEALCSEAHAEAFAAVVRAERARRAAAVSSAASLENGEAGANCAVASSGSSGWKRWGMQALCWGAPLLAVALLFGGAGWGAAEAALPYLALLACPLAMILMMRAMGSMQPSRSGNGQPVTGPRPEHERRATPVQAERKP
jgi:hypothetical protein